MPEDVVDENNCAISVPNYAEAFMNGLQQLQQTGSQCDVKLTATDGWVFVHRLVLMLASPYCRQRLENDMTEVLHIESAMLDDLQVIVKYMYTGSATIPTKKLSKLSPIATELMLQDLANFCNQQETVLQKTMSITGETTQGSPNTSSENSYVPFKKVVDMQTSKCSKNNVKAFPKKSKKRVKKAERKAKKYAKKSIKELRVSNGTNSKQRKDNKSEDTTLKTNMYTVKCEENCDVILGKKNSEAFQDIIIGEQSDYSDTQFDEEHAYTDQVPIISEMDNDDASPASGSRVSNYTKNPLYIKINKAKTKTSKIALPVACGICTETFDSLKSYRGHIRFHVTNGEGHNGDKYHWPCTVCSCVLTSAIRLACHKYSKHGLPYDSHLKLHTCPQEGCTYITASKHYLQIHSQGRHSNERPHVCEFCGKGFKLPSALATHLNIHKNEKQYQCGECNITFNQKGGLKLHMKKHHDGRSSWTELCHLCSEKFLQKADLCWHMYKEHQIPVPDQYTVFSCEVCDYQSLRKNKYKRHMETHIETKDWDCEVCLKKFSSKSYLRRHMVYHGEKSFKCTFDGCSYASVDRVGLRKHVRLIHTHKEYKPFQCQVCQYKTAVRGNLDKHIRGVHNLVVVTKHTVELRNKFKHLTSGDIITKDGQLLHNIRDTMVEGMEGIDNMTSENCDHDGDHSNHHSNQTGSVDMGTGTSDASTVGVILNMS